MTRSPTITAARKLAEAHGAKQALYLLFDGKSFASVSYGHTRQSCTQIGKLNDAIVRLINSGELPNPMEGET